MDVKTITVAGKDVYVPLDWNKAAADCIHANSFVEVPEIFLPFFSHVTATERLHALVQVEALMFDALMNPELNYEQRFGQVLEMVGTTREFYEIVAAHAKRHGEIPKVNE